MFSVVYTNGWIDPLDSDYMVMVSKSDLMIIDASARQCAQI